MDSVINHASDLLTTNHRGVDSLQKPNSQYNPFQKKVAINA